MFDEKMARRNARRYRRKGLDRAARWMVDTLAGRGLEEAIVLEIGGGVGAIQLELLKAGAERTVNVELSAGYEHEAELLAREAGLAGRSERRLGDAVDDDSIPPADVVVMHRVVCCYPDSERLVGWAAEHARRALVFTHPPANLLTRWAVAAANAWHRLTGRGIPAYIHAPGAMIEVARTHGLEPVARRGRGIWRGAALVRAAE
jgi:magnesium-protoporphyrin O-methyltransferase